jgi:hypothetical protein
MRDHALHVDAALAGLVEAAEDQARDHVVEAVALVGLVALPWFGRGRALRPLLLVAPFL